MDPEKGPHKCRRVDAAAALSRPFKSPLRRTQPDNSSQDSSPKTGDLADAAEPVPTKPTAGSGETTEATDHVPVVSTETRQVSVRCGPATCSSPAESPPSPPLAMDPEMKDLQRQVRQLESRGASLRFEQHAVCQAHSIQTKNLSRQLKELARKWRRASQKAADEVFENACQRIHQQGGFRAFKQRTKDALERERYGDLEPEQIEELKREAVANETAQDKTKAAEDDGDVSGFDTCLGLIDLIS